MPSFTPTVDAPTAASADEAPPAQDGWPGGLPALRAELDRIDDAIHELLIERAGVVEHVARSGKPAAFRPGREASIIRRLLARHEGQLPPLTLFRIWREMLAGTTSMQAPFVIAAAGNGDLAALAREHFGALTPLRMTLDDDDALRQVGDGQAAVAVLPIPVEDGHGWWTTLADRRLHIVARLPFWTARPLGAPRGQALVVAGSPPDASGHDRGFLTLESARIGALTEAGLPPRSILRDRGQALVQVDGLLAQDDPRLAGLGRVVVLGGYAVPVGGAA